MGGVAEVEGIEEEGVEGKGPMGSEGRCVKLVVFGELFVLNVTVLDYRSVCRSSQPR